MAASGSATQLLNVEARRDPVAEQATLEHLVGLQALGFRPSAAVCISCCRHHFVMAPPIRRERGFDGLEMTEGVFYASETPKTAVAEMAFYRLLFRRIARYPWPRNPSQYTAFTAEYATERAIDLTSAGYYGDRARWMHVFGLSALPSVRGHREGGQNRDHPLRVDSRSGRRNEPSSSHLPRVFEARADRPANLAHPSQRRRSSRGLRSANRALRLIADVSRPIPHS